MNLYKKRREQLMASVAEGKLVLFFSGMAPACTADSLYAFKPDKNFYYLTGLKREGFKLLLYKEKGSVQTMLFIDAPNNDVEKWYGRVLSEAYCKEVSGIENVCFLDDFKNKLHSLLDSGNYNTVALDLSRVNEDRPGMFAHRFAKVIKSDYPYVNIENLHSSLRGLRLIKDAYEIEQIRQAVALTKEGLERVMAGLKPGIPEYVAQADFQYSIMKNGAEGNAFETIAASGVNATILHYIENNQVMSDGDLILLDLGAQWNQYASDITRTYPINGRFTDRQKSIYEWVLRAQEAVIEMMAPGVSLEALNDKAKEVLTEGLLDLGVMDDEEDLSDYYYHSIGHSLGLDTHDLGRKDLILCPGMVLTVEPGLYIAEEKVGIRIEDDVLITDTGHEVLSADIIKTVDAIEKFMATCG